MLSISQFARESGVTRRSVQRRLETWLKPALVGGQVDEAHPLALWFVRSKGAPAAPPPEVEAAVEAYRAQRAGCAAPGRKEPAAGRVSRGGMDRRFGAPESVPLPDGSVLPISEIRDMPFGEVIDQWGWGPAFKEHLLALRALEEMRDKRLRVDERRGGLISRELVRLHVFGALDAFSRRLLTDMPRTLALRVRVTETPEEGETLARREIERELKAAKAEVVYALKQIDAGASKAQPEEEE